MADAGWAVWAGRIATEWTTPLQQAWEDAYAYAKASVEALSPSDARRTAQTFVETIWGTDQAPGLIDLRDRVRAKESILVAAGVDLDEVRARRAAELATSDVAVADPVELASEFMSGRIDWYAMGFLKDTKEATPRAGLAPLVIGGLVVGLVAVCWASVRLAEALVDLRRWDWMDRALQAELDGKKINYEGIAKAGEAGARPASSGPSLFGSGSSIVPMLAIGGAAALALVLLLRRA